MTQQEFDNFIAQNDLCNFDALITVKLKNTITYHHAVWITTIPPINEAYDGKYPIVPQCEIFYVHDHARHECLQVTEIDSIALIKEGYFKPSHLIPNR